MTSNEPAGAAAPAPSRRYGGLADLPRLLEFASRAVTARAPLFACWHPGDLIWELAERADQPQPARFWTGADGVDALAWFVGPGELWLEAMPGRDDLLAEAIGWGERRWAERAPPGEAVLKVRAQLADAPRIATYERLGFRRFGPEGVLFRFDLAHEPPPVEAPAGFRVRDSVGVDPARRAAAHRAAWSHLEHLGIHGESQFTTERYRAIAALPVYDPSLDMLVEGPDGELVANCVLWPDHASGVGVFEPVGTALAYRGRRLVRVMMREALRRLRQRGHREARVGTAHFNAAAIAAYEAADFELVDRLDWWAKPLR